MLKTLETRPLDSKVEAFEKDLRKRVRGDLHTDEMSRGLYATDASIYQMFPIAVFLPLDEEDVKAAVKTAFEHGIPILPRGGGTSLGGQTVGAALVLDFSKYMNKLLELNLEESWVRVQPGMVRDELNVMLAEHDLHLSIDPATANRANVGGMIGNNSSGTKSIIYGKMVDQVLEAKVLLTNGEVLEYKELSPEEYEEKKSGDTREALIYTEFQKIVEENREEIEKRYPKILRRVQGYNLDEFHQSKRWNLAKLITGSEGTLITLLEAKVKVQPVPKEKILCVAHYADLIESIKAVPWIVKHQPSAVEILDGGVIKLARENHDLAPLCSFIEGNPEAVLIVEFFGDDRDELSQRAEAMVKDLNGRGLGYNYPIFSDAGDQDRIWTVRKNGLGCMLGMKGERKPLPFIEDAAVPVEVLPEYIEKVLKICEKHETPVIMYAHASVGLIHVRPILDLRKQDDIDRMKGIADDTFELVKFYGGSWSGEHGDGRVRSAYLERFYGSQIFQQFKEIKNLFDPKGLMNPGNIVDALPMDHHLRFGTSYKPSEHKGHFKFRDDGNFFEAVHMCNGVGACRKKNVGTMCPSYMATLDEEHTTRGRANALRLAMSGQLGPDGMTSKRLHDVLDLCLSCKACKSECPSNVDMAKLKSEFLQGYYDKHGLKLIDRLIAASSKAAKFNSGLLAPLVNAVQGTFIFRKILEWLTGIDARRKLPEFTSEPFTKWFQKHSQNNGKGNKTKRVVLFNDTYINYHEPHIGRAATELLESCGYEVILAQAGCCQRPRISHGLLELAKRDGLNTLRSLDKFIKEGLDVVVCEPSCATAMIDDLPDLIDDEELGKRIKEHVTMIDVFIAREIKAGNISPDFISPSKDILIHGHCHQKAVFSTSAMKDVLGHVNGLKVSEINSGCCGMAGAFGYEKKHYDLSQKIGGERLYPAIRNRDEETTVVACGFSCRHQVLDAFGFTPKHWVEVVRGKK